ncbi:MAG: M16 family metallopeptidase [Oceanicaulis sp.]
MIKTVWGAAGAFAFAVSLAACTPPGTGQAGADTAPVPVFAHDVSDVPPDPGVRYGVLENGMRYAIMENDTPTDQAVINFVFNVGELAQDDDQMEVAHFLEHMNFNGTTNVPEGEMVRLLERYGLAFGPDTNAFTGAEATGYLLNLPSTSEDVLNAGLFLMRETASEMTFDEGALDRERGVIVGETRARNTPQRRYFEARNAFLYEGTRAARPLSPSDDYIQTLPRDEFVRFYNDFYVPERAMLVVVGDVDPDAVEAKIRDGFALSIPSLEVERAASFASWSQPDGAPDEIDLGDFPDFSQAREGFFYDPNLFTVVSAHVHTPAENAPDTFEARGEQLLLELGARIVQRRIQSEISAGTSPFLQFSLGNGEVYDLYDTSSALAVISEGRWEDGTARMEQAIRRAVEEGFTQAELDEQLANLETGLRNAAEAAGTRESGDLAQGLWGAWLSDTVFNHPDSDLAAFEERRGEITVEAVEAAFSKRWTANPVQLFLATNVELENGAQAIRDAWEASKETPVEPVEDTGPLEFAYTEFGEAGEIASQAVIEDLDVHTYVFENGVRLNVKQTDFEDNTIRMRADFGAGHLAPAPNNGDTGLLTSVFMQGGLEAHSLDELNRILAGRAASVNFAVFDRTFTLFGTTTPEDAALTAQVMAAYMTAPGWRQDGLLQLRAAEPEARRNLYASTGGVLTAEVNPMLRGGDMRWTLPPRETIDAFTMQSARTILEPALQSAPIEVTIVGDITPEDAAALVAETFAALPERDPEFPTPATSDALRFPAPTESPVVVRFNGEPNQAYALTVWPTADGGDQAEERRLSLLRSVFRLKATDVLREELGATYSPSVSSNNSEVFEGWGYHWSGVDVEPSNIPVVFEAIDGIAADIAGGGVSEDELQRARQPILESIEENLERNGYWLTLLSLSQAHPEALDEHRSAQSDYLALTPADISAAGARYLQPDRAWRAIVLAEGVEAP